MPMDMPPPSQEIHADAVVENNNQEKISYENVKLEDQKNAIFSFTTSNENSFGLRTEAIAVVIVDGHEITLSGALGDTPNGTVKAFSPDADTEESRAKIDLIAHGHSFSVKSISKKVVTLSADDPDSPFYTGTQ